MIIILKLLASLESFLIFFLIYSPFSLPSTLFSFSCQHIGCWLCSLRYSKFVFYYSGLNDIVLSCQARCHERSFYHYLCKLKYNYQQEIVYILLYSIISTLTKELFLSISIVFEFFLFASISHIFWIFLLAFWSYICMCYLVI